VDTAHVRVEGPGEPHPLDPVERAAAGLLAVLDAHRESVEQTFALQSSEAFLYFENFLGRRPTA
jgi:hypothetical protein